MHFFVLQLFLEAPVMHKGCPVVGFAQTRAMTVLSQTAHKNKKVGGGEA